MRPHGNCASLEQDLILSLSKDEVRYAALPLARERAGEASKNAGQALIAT